MYKYIIDSRYKKRGSSRTSRVGKQGAVLSSTNFFKVCGQYAKSLD